MAQGARMVPMGAIQSYRGMAGLWRAPGIGRNGATPGRFGPRMGAMGGDTFELSAAATMPGYGREAPRAF